MAFDIDYCTFEFLSVAKDLYDYGLLDKVLQRCGNMEVCEDYYSITWEGIASVFADFRQFFFEDTQIEAMVFCDPVITDFYRLCAMYEAKNGVPKDGNPLRREGENDVFRCFCLNAYDYGFRLYDGSHGNPRLVVLAGEEFYGHIELPGVLAEVKDTLERYCGKLNAAINAENSTAALPENTDKEAA